MHRLPINILKPQEIEFYYNLVFSHIFHDTRAEYSFEIPVAKNEVVVSNNVKKPCRSAVSCESLSPSSSSNSNSPNSNSSTLDNDSPRSNKSSNNSISPEKTPKNNFLQLNQRKTSKRTSPRSSRTKLPFLSKSSRFNSNSFENRKRNYQEAGLNNLAYYYENTAQDLSDDLLIDSKLKTCQDDFLVKLCEILFAQNMLMYRPLRDDFDVEFFDDGEKLISELNELLSSKTPNLAIAANGRLSPCENELQNIDSAQQRPTSSLSNISSKSSSKNSINSSERTLSPTSFHLLAETDINSNLNKLAEQLIHSYQIILNERIRRKNSIITLKDYLCKLFDIESNLKVIKTLSVTEKLTYTSNYFDLDPTLHRNNNEEIAQTKEKERKKTHPVIEKFGQAFYRLKLPNLGNLPNSVPYQALPLLQLDQKMVETLSENLVRADLIEEKIRILKKELESENEQEEDEEQISGENIKAENVAIKQELSPPEPTSKKSKKSKKRSKKAEKEKLEKENHEKLELQKLKIEKEREVQIQKEKEIREKNRKFDLESKIFTDTEPICRNLFEVPRIKKSLTDDLKIKRTTMKSENQYNHQNNSNNTSLNTSLQNIPKLTITPEITDNYLANDIFLNANLSTKCDNYYEKIDRQMKSKLLLSNQEQNLLEKINSEASSNSSKIELYEFSKLKIINLLKSILVEIPGFDSSESNVVEKQASHFRNLTSKLLENFRLSAQTKVTGASKSKFYKNRQKSFNSKNSELQLLDRRKLRLLQEILNQEQHFLCDCATVFSLAYRKQVGSSFSKK